MCGGWCRIRSPWVRWRRRESETIQPETEIEEEEPTLRPGRNRNVERNSDVPQVEENTDDTEHTYTEQKPTDISSVMCKMVSLRFTIALQLSSLQL